MTIKDIIFAIFIFAISTTVAYCQITKPYKAILPINAEYSNSKNAIESYQHNPSKNYLKNQKHPLDIWRDISPNNKEHILATVQDNIQLFLGEDEIFEIDTEFPPLHSHSFRQVCECVARTNNQPVATSIFKLPELRIFNIFRVDLDVPNAANWDEKQDFTNIWFNTISTTDIPQIEKAWNDFKRFIPKIPKCAFSLINCATKMSKDDELLCNRTGYIWNVISPDNYPASDEGAIGTLMVQYHNGTLISQVQSIITENLSPTNPWKLSESDAIQIAKDHIIDIYRKNKDTQITLDRISNAKPDVERVLWFDEIIDRNNILQYVPRNAYSIVFGFSGDWISPYLADFTIDATSGKVLDGSSTSKERRLRFKQFCNDLRTT